MIKYQKRIRLSNFDYKGYYRYYLTINTNYKSKLFTTNDIVRRIVKVLKDLTKKYGFLVWVYCFMPDHLHLLIEGEKEESDLRKFMAMFKQKTSFYFKRRTGKQLWQENYYEHVLRSDEDTIKVAEYILNNPIRSRLVKNYDDFPYSGSFILEDIRDLF